MEKINKIVILSIIVISFCRCAETYSKKGERIRIFYPLAPIETPVTLDNCDMIFGIPALTDTIIKDRGLVNHLDSIINLLKPSTDTLNHIDFRIKCVIRYSNQTESIICLGDKTGIVHDGKRMQDNEELFNIINDVIYKQYFGTKLSCHRTEE